MQSKRTVSVVNFGATVKDWMFIRFKVIAVRMDKKLKKDWNKEEKPNVLNACSSHHCLESYQDVPERSVIM